MQKLTIKEIVQELIENNIVTQDVGELLIEHDQYGIVLTEYREPTPFLNSLMSRINKYVVRTLDIDGWRYEVRPLE